VITWHTFKTSQNYDIQWIWSGGWEWLAVSGVIGRWSWFYLHIYAVKICLLLNTPAAVSTTLRCRRNSRRFEAGVPEKKNLRSLLPLCLSSFFIVPLFVFVLYFPFVCLRSLLSLCLSSFFIVPLFVFVLYCPPLFVFVLYCPFVCLRSLLFLCLSSFFSVPLFVFVLYCPFVCLRFLLSLCLSSFFIVPFDFF
jgi:hypothetical protein